MNASLDPLERSPDANSSAILITIVYDEFLSGARAKHFAERLAAGLGATCPLSESIWRSELLECPSIARQAASAAAGCDYLIVSLRGDRVLSSAARRWIEAQLVGGTGHLTCVIALLGSDDGKVRVLDVNRQYLRGVCAANRVEFFSHVSTPRPERVVEDFSGGEEAFGARFSVRRCLPAPLDD